jgi:hypothetical protein
VRHVRVGWYVHVGCGTLCATWRILHGKLERDKCLSVTGASGCQVVVMHVRCVQASHFDCRSFELVALITEQSMTHGCDTLTSTRSKTSIDSRHAEAMIIGAIASQRQQRTPPVGRTLPTVNATLSSKQRVSQWSRGGEM